VPTWGEELIELQDEIRVDQRHPPAPGAASGYDRLRRKYLLQMHQLTGRAVIVYETAYLEPRPTHPDLLTIQLGDVAGFMEAVSNIAERELDLILHSPGGSAEAAESIVDYLRTRFDHVRVFVPLAAMSAATMMSLAADEIVMGAHSQLGPIDPQFTLQTPEGLRSAPAQAIIDQFEMAKAECQDPKNITAWLPILRGYGPGLLAQCAHQRRLAEDLVAGWLERYMFRAQPNAADRARQIAAWFADFAAFKSHGRRVSRDDARAQGLLITDLESDHDLQDAVLSAHHAVQHSMGATAVAKIVENHHGRAWLKIQQVSQLVMGTGGPAPRQQGGARPPAGPNRGGGRRGRR
jgi:hypothetical protein